MENSKKEKFQSAYEILDLDASANQDCIKKNYLEKVRAFPPEKNPDIFIKIRKAYDDLKKYDIDSNFVFYQDYLQKSSENQQNKEVEPNKIELLKKYFEVPFNINYEIKSLLKKK